MIGHFAQNYYFLVYIVSLLKFAVPFLPCYIFCLMYVAVAYHIIEYEV